MVKCEVFLTHLGTEGAWGRARLTDSRVAVERALSVGRKASGKGPGSGAAASGADYDQRAAATPRQLASLAAPSPT